MDISQVPAHTKAGLIAMNSDKPLAKANKKKLAQLIIERYLDGTELKEQAAELNVHKTRIYQILLESAEDEWKAAQAANALANYEQAKTALDVAQDGLELARAREQIRTRQWELERVLKRIYGQDQQAAVPAIAISINLSGHSEREPVSIDAQAIDTE